jgi:hypothetical protein
MKRSAITITLFLLPGLLAAEEPSTGAVPAAKLERTYTVALQAGFTNTFQLILGGWFGQGAEFQNRMTVGVNNLLRKGDSLSVFGWSSTDMPSSTANWQSGVLYKSRVVASKTHTLNLTGGVQRWLLPSVKSGAMDWHLTGNLVYTAKVKPFPITVTGDSWTALRSTLPTGSAIYLQVSTLHPLLKTDTFQLGLRHGPAYSYSWTLYGANGHRVFRYQGILVADWKKFTIEGGARQQWGLQNSIRPYRYWSILVSRGFTGPLGRR